MTAGPPLGVVQVLFVEMVGRAGLPAILILFFCDGVYDLEHKTGTVPSEIFINSGYTALCPENLIGSQKLSLHPDCLPAAINIELDLARDFAIMCCNHSFLKTFEHHLNIQERVHCRQRIQEAH